MPVESADERHRGNAAARHDIRRAEATRVLGMLETSELPERARGWITDGADSRSVRALAAGGSDSDGIRLALVREIAGELGLAFASQQDARRFQAEEIIRARSFSVDVSSQIYDLANGYTDELVHRVRGFIARLARR